MTCGPLVSKVYVPEAERVGIGWLSSVVGSFTCLQVIAYCWLPSFTTLASLSEQLESFSKSFARCSEIVHFVLESHK